MADATKEFRAASDIVGNWIATCCDADPNAATGATVLYRSFASWAKATGEREISQREFGELLALRPELTRKRGTGGAVKWSGLALKDEDAP